MDEMQDYEVSDLIESLEFADRNLWEMTRLIMYQNIQMNTKKKIDIKDIIKFKWDTDQAIEQDISNNEVERLRKQAEAISKNMKNTQP